MACEVTLQPLRRFDLDCSIIFSDIMVVPQAMELECIMVPGKGPTFPKPLEGPECLDRINLSPDVKTSLKYVYDKGSTILFIGMSEDWVLKLCTYYFVYPKI